MQHARNDYSLNNVQHSLYDFREGIDDLSLAIIKIHVGLDTSQLDVMAREGHKVCVCGSFHECKRAFVSMRAYEFVRVCVHVCTCACVFVFVLVFCLRILIFALHCRYSRQV